VAAASILKRQAVLSNEKRDLKRRQNRVIRRAVLLRRGFAVENVNWFVKLFQLPGETLNGLQFGRKS
jgi:hypothetical protein